jgi:hypothetical protein
MDQKIMELTFKFKFASAESPQEIRGISDDCLTITRDDMDFGRIRNGEWVDVRNKPLDVLMWAEIPPLPAEYEYIFEDALKSKSNKEDEKAE